MGKIIKLKRRKRSKTHGFLKRNRSAGGKKVLKKRRQKGRKVLAVKKK